VISLTAYNMDGLQEEKHEFGQGKWGNRRAGVTGGSRNPKHGKRKHWIVHKPRAD
jgi:hypothetical protein